VLVLGYMALAVLGAGYVLVAMVLGHHGDADASSGDGDGASDADGGADYGVDQSGHGHVSAGGASVAAFHFPFFSPLALATLAASIGGMGLVAKFGAGTSDAASVLVAVPGALVVTYAVTWFAWKLASGSRGTSAIRPDALVGAAVEILTPIPAGGVGEAAAIVSGQRYTAPARERRGREVPRGAAARVVQLSGATLVVEIAAPLAAEEAKP
jgi:membrane protein implicated in regulation of membrane protease activity